MDTPVPGPGHLSVDCRVLPGDQQRGERSEARRPQGGEEEAPALLCTEDLAVVGHSLHPRPRPGSALRPEPSADSLLPPPRASGAVIMAPGKKARESVGSVDHRGAPADCVYLSGLRRGCVCWGGGTSSGRRGWGSALPSSAPCSLWAGPAGGGLAGGLLPGQS